MNKLLRTARTVQLRSFSTSGNQNPQLDRNLKRQLMKDKIDADQREKIKKAPEMDAKDDVSF